MSETSALIQLQNVSKIFYTDEVETHALDGVDLSIHPGEYVAISGPSGCGKSTLLSILGLLDSPTTGDYTLNGQPVAQLSQAERARTRNREVGFIFQSFQPDRRPDGPRERRAAADLPRHAAGRTAGAGDRGAREGGDGAPREAPAEPALRGAAAARGGGAGGGRAPCILLADEPTGNLDSKNGEAVMGLLRALHDEGSTVCMVTHDPRYAEHARREIHLFDGRCSPHPPTGGPA